jgi:maltose alpha-D-glucosyltransferase/alpha-amylase
MDYIASLGVDCIWLLPIYPSPLKDDGYDIADYRGIHPDYGTLEDFRAVIEAAHGRGMRVIADLVLNHTSDAHPWFQAARADRASPHRDYYVWSDTDKKYMNARIIFVDSERSNWTWDEQAGQYFWHRFYSSQPDLNYENPAVHAEMLGIVDFWMDLGIDGFRADAVPYLYELEGTTCENLPETHQFLRTLRAHMESRNPESVLLLEANQLPEDVRPYFGEGDEAHMAFHFPVMPRLFMALKKGRAADLAEILRRTPRIPESAQWCTFLRNHDELTLEMVTAQDREWMWAQYAPDPRMRLNLGIRRRLAPLLDNDRRKIELMNVLLFGLPGSPILYYGDEIGMGDDISLPDRAGVRTPMPWNGEPGAGFSAAPETKWFAPLIADEVYGWRRANVAAQEADPTSLLHFVRGLVQTRKRLGVFGRGDFGWLQVKRRPEVAAFWRRKGEERVLCVHNLADQPSAFELAREAAAGRLRPVLLKGEVEEGPETWRFNLPAYGYGWLAADSGERRSARTSP